MNDTTYTVYSSNSYLAQANKCGVEITNLHSGDTLWFQGDDAQEITTNLEVLASAEGASEEALTEHTDHYLSEYFTGSFN
jgi:hypothetical protein